MRLNDRNMEESHEPRYCTGMYRHVDCGWNGKGQESGKEMVFEGPQSCIAVSKGY